MKAEKEKSSDISGSIEVREMGIEELKDDDRVVLQTGSEGFELKVGADGGFIKRLAEVMKRHQTEVRLAVVGGIITAVILASERLRKQRR